MRLPYLCLSLAVLLGCEEAPPLGYFTDIDGDGVEDKEDCDDNNAGAGVEALYYPDYDHDGYGDPSEGLSTCDPPDSYVTDNTDCDDTDATIHPGAEESCDDAVDRNCDGSVAYEDADGDGWAACIECDDSDATVHPEATETCDGRDEDCDGDIDEDAEGTAVWYADADADGYGDLANPTTACNQPEGMVADATDCDDSASSVNPAAIELCNGIDDDCDGLVDDDAADAATWYGDGDSDGYGDDARLEYACEQPPGSVAGGGDCDDTDAAYNPGATETCTDTEDYNCDGSVGYDDADADGYAACEECDDSDPSINPAGTEACDDVDNDCDGTIDESDAIDAAAWYADADTDGYGDAASSTLSCDPVTGYVGDDTDCDDTVDTVNPGAAESCNGVDDDCDGTIDDGATDASTWYTDADGDGYGDDASTTLACDAPTGTSATGGDCDDTDADYHPGATETCTDTEDYNCDGSVGDADNDGDGFTACEDCDDGDAATYPGADETCDGIDNDCDGTVDESAIDPLTWYADADGDGFGDATSTATACDAPTGYVADTSDCDDTRADVSPAGIETCNNIDDDCDGTIDEDDAADALTWYADADADGYGFTPSTTTACEQPSGYAAASGDCDDADAAYNPGATETCTDTEDYNCDGSIGLTDADGDGWAACEECDDADASHYPGATEWCDGADDDCDGEVDEADAIDATSWYADADADGYGDASTATTACDTPAGSVADDTDCDDVEATVNPSAAETCNDIDDDCDGSIDEGASGSTTWYADADGDGYGDASSSTTACDAPSGYSDLSTDCDDTDSAYNPGATELCTDTEDYNCDGSIGRVDDDADGYAACEECDDADASSYPGADETCDGADNDCDGEVDEADAIDGSLWYADADSDGYGDPSNSTTACDAPTGYLADSSDCDDARSDINPAATEACNGWDDDCDGTIDEGATDASTWYADTDGDGYGDDLSSTDACDAPSGYTDLAGDCDDTDAAYNPAASETCSDTEDYNCDGSVAYADADGDGYAACDECDDSDAGSYPGATETCDGIDNDCDGDVDESGATGGSTWYADADGDGYGDLGTSTVSCDRPSGYVADDSDCDDSRADVSPAGAESCNGIDDDCNGTVDDGAIDGATWYADADGDGYGDSASTTTACDQPSGYVAATGDCDDTDTAYNPGATETCVDSEDYNCDGSVGRVDDDGDGYAACVECDDSDASTYPGADETCDGTDNDCDGDVDEDSAIDASTWYADDDGDGYGDASDSTVACDLPSGYLADDSDCDDARSDVHPTATELCDGLDNDCDGSIDEGATGASTWYADDDGDGYGDDAATTDACDAPSGYVALGGDCDDTDAAYNPGATEACDDPTDYNCDGSVSYVDDDLDGYAACEECDDSDAGIYPGATETCDGADNDCDGSVDESGATGGSTWYADADGDGYGDASTSTVSCSRPSGYVADDSDCDDGDDTVHPAAAESCNGVDDDCDGSIDDGAGDATTWYADTDNDGYGDDGSTTEACDAPSGYVAYGGDCDDTDAAYNPGASESCDDPTDYNCDGSVSFADDDGDGVAACSDCDDGDAASYPGADELCDGADNDCDGAIDEDEAIDALTWYDDDDGDGYGDPSQTTAACDAPTGYAATGTDCDDTDSAVNPGATESCDGLDNDCDGSIDEGLSTGTWYADNDSDGYGDGSSAVTDCAQPSGTVTDATDCDDGDSAVNPGAPEVCDGLDNDCDGSADNDAFDASNWYADDDNDGYGDDADTVFACDVPSGYVAYGGDCDDTDAAYNPGATETCTDPEDFNCDGSVAYADADSDGWAACEECDDSDATVNPSATEVCNGIDDDCDGDIDTGATDATTWYTDADDDAYGDDATATLACDMPAGSSAVGGDCDESDASINPGAAEVCDGVDQDCNGTADDGLATSTWYADADADTYGDLSTSYTGCAQPTGYVSDSDDCDDTDAAVNPAAVETCNGIDDDCNGLIDDGGVCSDCELEYYGDDDVPYLFCYGDRRAWSRAALECEGYGYEIVTIDDDTENSWVTNTANSYETGRWWIGLSDRDTEGTYAWYSGTAVSYTNWAPGEPNDPSGHSDCVAFGRNSTETWSDEQCNAARPFVCEGG